MTILYLNVWGGEVQAPLAEFLKRRAQDTDVFCFQEADGSIPSLCDEILTDFNKVSAHKFVTKADDFYQVTYARKSHAIAASGVVFAEEANVGLGVYVQLTRGKKQLYICNFHGMSRPTDKRDTPARRRQSQGLIEAAKDKNALTVIGGDFNVFPHNESLGLFEEHGYRDLIKGYGITNTRNHYVWDRYPDNPKQYYSDYIFVSQNVPVNSFVVPDIEVSDHLPLVLEVAW